MSLLPAGWDLPTASAVQIGDADAAGCPALLTGCLHSGWTRVLPRGTLTGLNCDVAPSPGASRACRAVRMEQS